jgi:hypothetical protein
MNSDERIRIREQYIIANCCKPCPEDDITGYHSHDDCIKIHKMDCSNLANVEHARLVPIDWRDVLEVEDFVPDDLYRSLEENDFRILALHRKVGRDYSLKVARLLGMDRKEVFDRHKKLREMGLLQRVPAVMIRYRKGIVDNKWIKHRNHTYYELTEKGRSYAEYFMR